MVLIANRYDGSGTSRNEFGVSSRQPELTQDKDKALVLWFEDEVSI